MRKYLYLFLIVFIILNFTRDLHSEDNNFPLELIDKGGRKVLLKTIPKRIISLSPSSTEMLFYLGLSDRIIAVSATCNYPPQAMEKDKIGDINLNIEKIVDLRPDLIVAEKGLFGNLADQCDKLGLNILLLDSDSIDSIFDSIILLGKATDEVKVSNQLVSSLKKELSFIEQGGHKKRKIRVFVEIWHDPFMTAGKKNFINQIVSIAGGENVASDIDKDFIQISSEWIMEKDPEIIILTSPGYKDMVFKRKSWENVSAVKNRQVYEIDPDIFVRPTPRIIISMRYISFWINRLLNGN